MSSTRRAFLGLTASTVALAGCLGGGGATDDPTATAAGTPATVSVRSHQEYGELLVDADGLTLYRFDADTPDSGASACADGCAEAWPPLTVEGSPTAGNGVSATLSTFERADGGRQVTADGWPLYRFASDEGPGDVNGQGANDAWWAVAPDGAAITAAEESNGRSY